jgi:ABC-type sugar transport system ATPase subunit
MRKKRRIGLMEVQCGEFLRLEGVSKHWPGGVGVEDLNFSLGNGEIVGLVGRTGAGKSTVLRLIAGLEACESGRIFNSGQEMTSVEPHLRGVSMIFQRPVFYPGRMLTKDLKEAEKKGVLKRWQMQSITLDWLIEELQLSEKVLSQRPETFSGGEARRASILTAMLQDRPIILADEPLTGLDPDTRERVSRLLWKFVRRTGKAMIVVLHEPADALGMADRIIVLQHGRIVQKGSPSELLERPESVEVIKLLHFPPANEVTFFVENAGHDRIFVSPQYTFATLTDASEGEIRVNYLRDRWVAGVIYSEWVTPENSHIYWTPKPAEKMENALLKWENGREMRIRRIDQKK